MGPERPSLTGRRDRVRLFPVEPWSVAPQPLEVVEGALLRPEDVHDHVDVVEEPPARVTLAFAPRRADIELLLQGALDLIDHRLDLAGGSGGADHEVVRDHDQLADVQDDDVLGLLRRGGSGGCGGRVAAPRGPPPPPLPGGGRPPGESPPPMNGVFPLTPWTLRRPGA